MDAHQQFPTWAALEDYIGAREAAIAAAVAGRDGDPRALARAGAARAEIRAALPRRLILHAAADLAEMIPPDPAPPVAREFHPDALAQLIREEEHPVSGRDDIGERRRAAHDQTYVRLPDGSRSRPIPPCPSYENSTPTPLLSCQKRRSTL